MKDPTIAKLTELLEQQLSFNRTLINASVPNVCSPADAMKAQQTIKSSGGFSSYVLGNSRSILEVLDILKGGEDGDSGTA